MPSQLKVLQRKLRQLYEGTSPEAHRFRYLLLAFDLITLLFIVTTSFLPRTQLTEVIDIVFGVVILADFAVRMFISRRPMREFLHWATWADIAAIVSFFAPLIGEGAAFLRILRTVRLLRTYQLLARLRADSPFFRRNEEVLLAVTNLAVFIFIMTGIVYETQHYSNPQIVNYVDALYFTVTALTTTGFGDITLPGSTGRMISVIIMIFGITLFLNLARALFRASKVRFPCPQCGLQLHDYDAVHCKACGIVLNIPDEGGM
jgi:voltage-gated potassium channel